MLLANFKPKRTVQHRAVSLPLSCLQKFTLLQCTSAAQHSIRQQVPAAAFHSEPNMYSDADIQHLWRQSVRSCRPRTMEQSSIAPERRWHIVQWIPVVAIKTFLFGQWGHGAVWTVLTAPLRNIRTYFTYLLCSSRWSSYWFSAGSTTVTAHWLGLPINLQVQRFQSAKNAAERLIFRLCRYDHITDAFIKIQWLRVHERIRSKLSFLGLPIDHLKAALYACHRTSPASRWLIYGNELPSEITPAPSLSDSQSSNSVWRFSSFVAVTPGPPYLS